MAQHNPRTPKMKGAMKIGCLIPFLIIGLLAFYFWGYPALTPDTIRGSLLSMTMARAKGGTPLLWVVTDGSFNYIQKTETPGRMSVGRKCLFCKTWTYVYDPAGKKIKRKIETKLDDIVTVMDMAYGNGYVWIIMSGYGKNGPRIEAYDAETAKLAMDTAAFTKKHPLLRAGISSINYNDREKIINLDTKDGLQGIQYCITTDKMYRDRAEWRGTIIRDDTPSSMAVLAMDRGGPRKKLVLVSGPRGKLTDNASSFAHYAADEHQLAFFTGARGKLLTDRVFLEGIIYHQDDECAIIIYLDQVGKKANRLMSCYDLSTGLCRWNIKPDQMFGEMKIDEEDDSFSSLFFTKDHIRVLREGELVALQLKGVGVMGFDYKTGKRLWTIKI